MSGKHTRLILAALLLVLTVVLYWVGRPPSSPAPVTRESEPTSSEASPVGGEPALPAPPAAPQPGLPLQPDRGGGAPGVPAVPPAAVTSPADAGVSPPETPRPQEQTIDPQQGVEEVRTAIRDFRTALGENPVGTNEEITQALLGNNLKQVKLPVPAGSRVSAEGELVDAWGTAYFFHQLSGTEMEVRSAGPDRKMWTSDDAVTR